MHKWNIYETKENAFFLSVCYTGFNKKVKTKCVHIYSTAIFIHEIRMLHEYI